MSKILFFNPPSRRNVYLSTNVKVGAPSYPSLTLATLAGRLINKNDVKIIDLDLINDYLKILFEQIDKFKPDLVASTSNTPDYPCVKHIMRQIKADYPSIKTIVGGVHVTAMPQEAAKEDCFDTVVTGEADNVLEDALNTKERIYSGKNRPILNLDTLPYPAWNLFGLDKYKNSRLSSRRNPVGLIETSRGCAYQCNFCNKLTFGSEYRAKTPKRVVDEMQYLLKCGFKEIHIVDDSFTQDINRAKEISNEIIKRNLKFPWALISGIRVDMVDSEFFKLAKKSGCWQVGFGIESGDQDILDRINKKTTLAQIENAVKLARAAGISAFGFFILALSQETEASMRRTIEFAKRLPLDIAKFDICIPYPGTAYYQELREAGRIKSSDWSRYICHQVDEPLFDHPNLTWPLIRKYYKTAFREFYLRPAYILKRFLKGLVTGNLAYDIKYFLQSEW